MTKKYYRKKHGRGFRYVDGNGKTVRDEKLKEWFRSLVIPPAWTDVEISGVKSADLLATGRDVKGRKQYIYHPDFVAHQNTQKFNRIVAFGEKLASMREVTEGHLRKREMSREKVLAAMVRLMDEVYLRPGHPRYTQENNSYGLTTLRSKHVEISGNEITFTYVGKSGQEQEHHIRDARLARIVRELDEMPGYRIFKYVDENGKRHEVTHEDLNTYIRESMGDEFSCKDFRTWAGTLLAAKALDDLEVDAEEEAKEQGDDDKKKESDIQAVVFTVAESLGNTPAIALSSYIDPRVLEMYRKGKTLVSYSKQANNKSEKSSNLLSVDEICLLCMSRS